MSVVDLSSPLARALAQRQVDPNEVAKCFAHLRTLHERAGEDKDAQRAAVEQWWRWLETVAGPGARAVVRSNRTQEYYRTIQDACRYHLRDVAHDPDQLVRALGWAVRLMRYYRNVPGAIDRPALLGGAAPTDAPKPPPPRELDSPTEPARLAPKAPTIPDVGETFTGKVLEIDESAVAIEVPGFGPERALGVIKAENLAGRKYREGNAARVQVIGVRTLKSGRTIVELKPAKREEDKAG